VGDGVGLRDFATGRIIALVPTPVSSFRLSTRAKRTLARLAREQGKSNAEVLELAIVHLEGTLRNGQPVYLAPPPGDDPKSHKKAARVA
jgi:hypothetical protein